MTAVDRKLGPLSKNYSPFLSSRNIIFQYYQPRCALIRRWSRRISWTTCRWSVGPSSSIYFMAISCENWTKFNQWRNLWLTRSYPFPTKFGQFLRAQLINCGLSLAYMVHTTSAKSLYHFPGLCDGQLGSPKAICLTRANQSEGEWIIHL